MLVVVESDFDLEALGEAVDAARRSRGLTWAGLARELAERFSGTPGLTRHMAASTIKGIRTRSVAEGDGVLQLLAWLDRAPESFVPGHPSATSDEWKLPELAPGLVPRWDAPAVHRALDAERADRGVGWAEVARQIGGCTAGVLTGLSTAPRVGVPQIVRIVGWLGRPAASFVRASPG